MNGRIRHLMIKFIEPVVKQAQADSVQVRVSLSQNMML